MTSQGPITQLFGSYRWFARYSSSVGGEWQAEVGRRDKIKNF